MLRLIRVALLVVMTFFTIGLVVALGSPGTGPAEKVVLGGMIVGMVLLAIPVRNIGTPATT